MACRGESIDFAEVEKVVIGLAREAGKLVVSAINDPGKSVEAKQSYADLVTETDKNIEKFVFGELARLFPQFKRIGEESVAADDYGKVNLTDEPTWIVDPIDGTMNFVHCFPYVAVCIGLAVDKRPVLGVVYCPAMDLMYSAHEGSGAFLNGKRISVAPVACLNQALICTEMGSDRSDAKRQCVFKNLDSVAWQCHGIRSLGSAAMNIISVASGQTNGFYEFGLHCWDMCAPVAILREAGGFACDTTAQPLDLCRRRIIVASSESVARQLSAALPVQMDLPSD